MNAKKIDKKAKESYKKRVVSCKQKHRHPDEATARAAAMGAIQKYHNVEKLHVYNCPVCSGWHLSKKGDDIAVTEEDPFNENIKVQQEILAIIKTGPIKTISSDSDLHSKDDIWLYNLCLELEANNKIYRSNVIDDKIEWKYRQIQTKKPIKTNKQQDFLMAA